MMKQTDDCVLWGRESFCAFPAASKSVPRDEKATTEVNKDANPSQDKSDSFQNANTLHEFMYKLHTDVLSGYLSIKSRTSSVTLLKQVNTILCRTGFIIFF